MTILLAAYTVSHGMKIMDNKWERTWKEVVIAYFEVISQHSTGRAEENPYSKPAENFKLQINVNQNIIY
jgi:hypothetical protein